MDAAEYEYLLPIFVGHPFRSRQTEGLRTAIQLVCNAVNERQGQRKRFLWVPRFLGELDESQPTSVLHAVTEALRQSALSLFEITDCASPNVFLELGIAIGMGRSMALLMRKPYSPPADLRGLRGIEYEDELDLQIQVRDFLEARLRELQRPPSPEQSATHLKMQIDANWVHRIQTATKALYFFAGDVSWAKTYSGLLQGATERGVTVRVCCREPDPDEAAKWRNVDLLKGSGCHVKLFGPLLDPRVRGLVVDPSEMSEVTEVMIVEKETRRGGRKDYERTGWTIGESEFLYTATLYRGNRETRLAGALIRLFEATWRDSAAKSY
ncbi:MAG TPA: hypothetical protein VNE39_19950 [Planctomycetota bacterium]|nr:hypothetical protein [Planctomycetota bacterium]